LLKLRRRGGRGQDSVVPDGQAGGRALRRKLPDQFHGFFLRVDERDPPVAQLHRNDFPAREVSRYQFDRAEVGDVVVRDVQHVESRGFQGPDVPGGRPEFETESLLPAVHLSALFPLAAVQSPWLYPSIEKGVLTTPVLPERKLQMIALPDIGEFATEAFLNPEEFRWKEINLAGDQRKIRDAAPELSCAMNRPIRYEPIPEEGAEGAVGYDLTEMYRWFQEVGYDVDIEGLRDRFGIRLTLFSRYLGRSGLFRKAA